MFAVEVYAAVRHFVFIEGNSRREAARVFGLSRETVSKMCRFSLPPGYTRTKPVTKPKLGTLLPVIDAILEADRTAPVKQRHTAKRIFERLRDEHGYPGGATVVKDYVRIARGRLRETFVPLAHPPGHAQVDFGEAVGEIGGVRRKIHFFCMDLPHSDAPFVKAYPAETTEAFLDGHVSAFAFFGGVPLSILYDNTTIAVAKICGDGKRERTRAFTEVQSHYLFRDRFGRPGKGNDKGKVEGLVKYARSNFMTPIPQAASFDDLDAMLEERCRRRRDDRAGRHDETIGNVLSPICGLSGPACGAVGALREAGCPRLVDRSGPLPLQRLFGADGIRLPGRAGEGLRRRGGDPLRRAGDRPTPPELWHGHLRVRAAALPRADRDEAECPRSGCTVTGLGSAGGVPAPAPSPGGAHGQPRPA
jgi:transposase